MSAPAPSTSGDVSITASEKKWNATAQLYIKYFEPTTVTMGLNLLSCLKLHSSSESISMIECGSGSGGLAIEIHRRLSTLNVTNNATNDTESVSVFKKSPVLGHKLCLVDLSKTMTELATGRLNGAISGSSTVAIVGVDVQFLVSDATSLKQHFPDCSFNRYICNMTLHYVPDGDALLREAARLLCVGGMAGFSVWGRESLSDAFTILPKTKTSLGLSETTPSSGGSGTATRSNFHMGEDDEALRLRVLAAGFKSCVIWHSLSVLEAVSAAEYTHTMTEGAYSTQQEMLQWSPEERLVFLQKVKEAAAVILQSGRPIGLDVCYIVATK